MLEQLILGSFKLDTPGYIHDGERHLSLSTLVLSMSSAGFEPLLEKSLMSARSALTLVVAFAYITGALLFISLCNLYAGQVFTCPKLLSSYPLWWLIL